jgi:hypothetical protein
VRFKIVWGAGTNGQSFGSPTRSNYTRRRGWVNIAFQKNGFQLFPHCRNAVKGPIKKKNLLSTGKVSISSMEVMDKKIDATGSLDCLICCDLFFLNQSGSDANANAEAESHWGRAPP